MLRITQFRVQNYRNIDDSGWIPVERVTNFVGRNECGKTALLKALHKFNPAIPDPYDPQKEFPRDRYTCDYTAKGSKGGDWPVCSVAFVLTDDLKTQISALLGPKQTAPSLAVATRYYDGSLLFDYDAPKIEEKDLTSDLIVRELGTFASSARRLATQEPEREEELANLRIQLAEWATGWQDKLKGVGDLRNAEGAELLDRLRSESEEKSCPQTADMVELFQTALAPVLEAAKHGPVLERVGELIKSKLPVLIYFENYGVLDSAIWLPRIFHRLHG